MVERHRQHVKSDEQHDEHVELFVRYNLEDDGLWLPLYTGLAKRNGIKYGNIKYNMGNHCIRVRLVV